MCVCVYKPTNTLGICTHISCTSIPQANPMILVLTQGYYSCKPVTESLFTLLVFNVSCL
jgi:hypothetical protein